MKPATLAPAVGFVTVSIGEMRSFTLTSVLGVFLHSLEMRYGQRDLSYTLLGIEFGVGGPMIWYPGNRKYVSIMLSLDAAEQPNRALWQLAHECVHLLAPSGGSHAPVVEEGLAFLFAKEASMEWGYGFEHDDSVKYIEAAETTRTWTEVFPQGIVQTRLLEPCFTKWTPEIICRACVGVASDLAVALCKPF